MYTHENIKWIKSVTRDGGTAWAYMEYDVGDIFTLHFPKNSKWFPTNYERPKPNDLILLFQTLLPHGDHPGGWCITHLVTPTSFKATNDNTEDRPYHRPVMVIGKANPAYIVSKKEWSLYKPNRGVVCGVKTIERKVGKDFSIQQKQKFLWSLFNAVNIELDETISELIKIEDDDEVSAEEGAIREIMKLHKYKERDKDIIRKAKAKAKKENRLYCEVCAFDFEIKYPVIGTYFIECHHKLPIATGGIRKTKIDDLAMVCANCHRMLHRKLDGEFPTIQKLREIIRK